MRPVSGAAGTRWLGRASLSSVPQPVRQVASARGGLGRILAGPSGLDGGRLQGRRAGCLDRLAARAAVITPASDCRQQSVRDVGGARLGSQPGFPDNCPQPAPPVERHAGAARLSGSSGRDVRRPVALRRDLLPSIDLAAAGPDEGVFPAAGRLGALAAERAAEGDQHTRT